MGRKKRFGDRPDGRRLRTVDPFFKIIPYIMSSRADSQVFFESRIDYSRVEEYINNKRREGIKNIKFLHIVMAAMVRIISQKPRLNRFIAGQKLFARNETVISLAIKKQLNEAGEETTLKFKFKPTDTLFEVANKVNSELFNNKKEDNKNDTDKLAGLIGLCPGFVIKFLVWLICKLDYFGLLPKAVIEASPFHATVFITDMGSIGMDSVYHHIYNFGTVSTFIGFGTKQKEKVIDENNNITTKKYISVKVVADERIVDGQYYASSFKIFKRLIENPEKLEISPEKVYEDVE
jgi:hypothetical protein